MTFASLAAKKKYIELTVDREKGPLLGPYRSLRDRRRVGDQLWQPLLQPPVHHRLRDRRRVGVQRRQPLVQLPVRRR